MTDLLLLRTTLAIRQKSRQPSFWEVVNSFDLLTYTSSAASRTLMQQLLDCLNFPLDSSDLFCWYKGKKVISMNYGSSTSSWKKWRWVRLDLVLTMRDIYINSNLKPPTKLTSSSRNTEFKDILPWNISQMITKTILTFKRIATGYVMNWDIPFWIWRKVDGNWNNEHGQNFPMEWKSLQKKY